MSKAYRMSDEPFHRTEREVRWHNLLRPKKIPWLHEHQIQGQMVFPGVGYVSTTVEAVKALNGKKHAG
jgi:hybrid polyketide synthase / nonribosomal peptide synthetase ACE1